MNSTRHHELAGEPDNAFSGTAIQLESLSSNATERAHDLDDTEREKRYAN